MTKLRKYQQDIVDQVIEQIKGGKKRILVQSPAGSGKSIIIAELTRRFLDYGDVLFIVHRQELIDNIIETYKKEHVDMTHVKVTTPIRSKKEDLSHVSLVITDEAHHSMADTYRQVYRRVNGISIGFTATPIRLDGKALGEEWDALVQGLSVDDLITQGYLSPFIYYSIPISVKTRASESQKTMDEHYEQLFEKNHLYGNVVEEYKKHAQGKKAILYAPTIRMSKRFAEAFNQEGIRAIHVDGETNKTKRSDIMNQFKHGEIQILCNVDLVSEGFNVPDCKCSILCRPTKSVAVFIQQAMRCMRKIPYTHETAVIIDCAANGAKMGLPNDPVFDDMWTLEGKSNKRMNVSSRYAYCPHCNATLLKQDQLEKCPYCGEPLYILKSKALEYQIDNEVELQKISDEKPTKCSKKYDIITNTQIIERFLDKEGYENPNLLYKVASKYVFGFGIVPDYRELKTLAEYTHSRVEEVQEVFQSLRKKALLEHKKIKGDGVKPIEYQVPTEEDLFMYIDEEQTKINKRLGIDVNNASTLKQQQFKVLTERGIGTFYNRERFLNKPSLQSVVAECTLVETDCHTSKGRRFTRVEFHVAEDYPQHCRGAKIEKLFWTYKDNSAYLQQDVLKLISLIGSPDFKEMEGHYFQLFLDKDLDNYYHNRVSINDYDIIKNYDQMRMDKKQLTKEHLFFAVISGHKEDACYALNRLGILTVDKDVNPFTTEKHYHFSQKWLDISAKAQSDPKEFLYRYIDSIRAK